MNVLFFGYKKCDRGYSFIRAALLLLPLILVFGFSGGQRQQEAVHRLNIKQVITDEKPGINSNYEYGKELYPEYSYHGLPETFLIKKSAGISFRPSDIESIRIAKLLFIPADLEEFTVTITFTSSAGKRLHDFTKRNLDSRIALEIDRKIFIIATIMDPIGSIMNITVGNRSVEEIRKELSKVSKNIIIDLHTKE
jgi:hypothetical protein